MLDFIILSVKMMNRKFRISKKEHVSRGYFNLRNSSAQDVAVALGLYKLLEGPSMCGH